MGYDGKKEVEQVGRCNEPPTKTSIRTPKTRPPSTALGSGSWTRNIVAPAQMRWRLIWLCFACCAACFLAFWADAEGWSWVSWPARWRSDCVDLLERRVERRRARRWVRVFTAVC